MPINCLSLSRLSCADPNRPFSMNESSATTPAPETQVVRHTAWVRLLHWSLAVAYLGAIATGFALYWQQLLGWLTPYFGGYNQTIYIHFWAGIILVLFTFLLGLAWRGVVRWTTADSEFVRQMPHHALHPGQPQPADTGFFNGGQKLYFWAVIASGVVFLVTVSSGVSVIMSPKTSMRFAGLPTGSWEW